MQPIRGRHGDEDSDATGHTKFFAGRAEAVLES